MPMDVFETTLSGHLVSTDVRRIDIDAVHAFLDRNSTWAQGIPRATVEVAIANSLNFGMYEDGGGGRMVAFCRIVTDHSTFGNLVDVFVLPGLRGRGLSKLLMSVVMAHPVVSGLRRFTLATTDAHGLYAKFGFTALNKPETFMEIYRPGIYRS